MLELTSSQWQSSFEMLARCPRKKKYKVFSAIKPVYIWIRKKEHKRNTHKIERVIAKMTFSQNLYIMETHMCMYICWKITYIYARFLSLKKWVHYEKTKKAENKMKFPTLRCAVRALSFPKGSHLTVQFKDASEKIINVLKVIDCLDSFDSIDR